MNRSSASSAKRDPHGCEVVRHFCMQQLSKLLKQHSGKIKHEMNFTRVFSSPIAKSKTKRTLNNDFQVEGSLSKRHFSRDPRNVWNVSKFSQKKCGLWANLALTPPPPFQGKIREASVNFDGLACGNPVFVM